MKQFKLQSVRKIKKRKMCTFNKCTEIFTINTKLFGF